VDRSTPKRTFSPGKREFFIFLLILSGIAVLLTLQSTPARVTISGLSLDDTRDSVASHLQNEDFRSFSPGEWEERWYRMDDNGINVVYDESGSVHNIVGGVPEIDGADATHWTLDQIEGALGPAPMVGSSREVGDAAQGHLSYPQHRLLIYLKPAGNRFLLFEPGR
jgi:hypothetical protein